MKKHFFLLSFSILFCTSFVSTRVCQAASLNVKAAFEGQAPVAAVLKADADPKCKMLHPEGISDDAIIVNANGTLKDVFVYVKEGLSGQKFDTPKEAVVFDQVGCQYTPKVLGIQVNQPLEIRNSDDTLHNVHALPTNSQAFNLGMPIKGMKLKKTFAKPEVMVKVKCEVHPWMRGYIGVLEHPFYGVTDENGVAQIKNLPAGEYVIEVWHEKYGTQTQTVTVAEADQELAFSFKA